MGVNMAITHDQLVEGGPVFYRAYTKGAGSAELRRLPARVLEVYDKAAKIELLGSKIVREVKFLQLEPDLDWLSQVYADANRAQAKRIQAEAKEPVRTPMAEVLSQARIEPVPDPQAHLFKEPEPAVEPKPDVPQITLYEGHPSLPPAEGPEPLPGIEHTAEDLDAYLEIGKGILKRLEATISITPEGSRASLEERRETVVRHMEEVRAKQEGESMPRKRGERIKPVEVVEKVLKDLRAGMTQREVAKKHKVSTGSIHYWAKDAELAEAHAEKGAGRKGGIPALPDALRQAALADVAAGMSLRAAAKKHRVSYATVMRWAEKAKRNEKNEKKAEKKQPGKGFAPYPEELRRAVLADVDAGMLARDAAEKHGITKGTVYAWMRGEGTGRPGGRFPKVEVKLEGPKPQLEVKAEPEQPNEPPPVWKAGEENKRLRAAIATLIAQAPTVNTVQELAEENRRLRAMINLWLGLS